MEFIKGKIEVKKSSIHGLGVFATDRIESNEIIEECPILLLPTKRGELNYTLIDYTFQWPRSLDWTNHAIALGYGSLYNHSNNPNSDWFSDEDKNVFKFVALREIYKGEEITIYYGGDEYWNDGRTHVEMK